MGLLLPGSEAVPYCGVHCIFTTNLLFHIAAGSKLHQISTRTDESSNYNYYYYNDEDISITICSNATCCTTYLPSTYYEFQRRSIDRFSGSDIDPCDRFEYDPQDVTVNLTKTYYKPWTGLYVQLRDSEGNATRCQGVNGTAFQVSQGQSLALNCSDAPESKAYTQ